MYGLPWWLRWYGICLQCGRPEFDSWIGKVLWRKEWQHTPVFLWGEPHGQRILVGYSPSSQKVGHDWLTKQQHSAYILNQQADNTQPCCTPFPTVSQSVVLCKVLTVPSWPPNRFLRRQVRWSGNLISKNFPHSVVLHTIKGFSVASEEVDGFLEFPCFLHGPETVSNLICFFYLF